MSGNGSSRPEPGGQAVAQEYPGAPSMIAASTPAVPMTGDQVVMHGGPAAGDHDSRAGRGKHAHGGDMAGVLLSGRYRLEHRIATGGMGEVWRGCDEVLGRPVAIKLLKHAYIGDQALASRFRAEARYAASLSHPAIAQVFDYGEQNSGAGNQAFLVMELVPGEPLSAILARAGRLSAEAALDIIGQAASALQAAHSAGIVHRDIKPGNLLVTASGRVKITDFGIARAVQAAQAGHLTQTGMVMGTAQYVSPEQASGMQVTHASDIYSLGVVAYECLAGAPPFSADALIALALAHVREQPPPLPPSVPPAVSDLVMRMLAKRPENRPASAQAVADRATILCDAMPVAPGPGLADVASEGPAEWFSEGTVTSPRLHGGVTTQLPVNEPQRLASAWRWSIRRRGLVVAVLSATMLGLGGVVAAVTLGGHHASATGGSTPSHSSTPHVSHSAHRVVRNTPSQNPPAVTAPSQSAPAPSATASASPTPAKSPSPSPTPSASATSTGSPSPSPTDTGTGTPTPPQTSP
jgi:eukaryotic-like serine/threonine-protein kinase